MVEHLVNADGFGLSFNDDLVDDARAVSALERLVGKLANKNLGVVGLTGAFQSRGEIHAVANHGVVGVVGGADAADDDLVGVEADADVDGLFAAFLSGLIELFEIVDHRDGGADAAVGLVVVVVDVAKAAHERVANDLVDGATFGLHALLHLVEVLIEHCDGAGRAEFFGQGREPANVGE